MYNGKKQQDRCLSSTLVEYSCNRNRLIFENYQCPNGCSNGICVSLAPLPRPVIYGDGDSYICENINDPDWIWNFDLSLDPVKIGVENRFTKNDAIDAPPLVGECYILPRNTFIICMESYTVRDQDYQPLVIRYDPSVDLSDAGFGTNEKVIELSTNTGGFQLDKSMMAIPNANLVGTTFLTDTIYIQNLPNKFLIFFEEAVTRRVHYLGSLDYGYGKSFFAKSTYYGGASLLFSVYSHYYSTGRNIGISIITSVALTPGGPNHQDDLNITFGLINNQLTGLGTIPAQAESQEIIKGSYIGLHTENDRLVSGIILEQPSVNGMQDQVKLKIPRDQVKANIVVKDAQNSVLARAEVPLGAQIKDWLPQGISNSYDRLTFGSFAPNTPTVMTSLTSQDNDYGESVALEVVRGGIGVQREIPRSTFNLPFTLNNFIGRDIVITIATPNSITLSQAPQCP